MDFSDNPMYEPSFEFYDKNLLYDVKQGNANVHDFFRLLALCHTVMTDNKDDGKCITYYVLYVFSLTLRIFAGQLEYQAPSPDENALDSSVKYR